MGTVTSGTYPVYDNTFEIGTAGKTSTVEDMKTIADLETFSVSIDNNIEEWNPMEAKGWIERMLTGKGFSITLNGKRNIGDAGNDYVASKAMAVGQEAETKFKWIFADGTTVEFNCLISVTNPGTGDSRNVAPLEFEVLSKGKPTVTPAV